MRKGDHIPWLVIITTCSLLILSFGIRSGFGLFVKPITETYGWGREVISTAIATQNLFWGITSIFAGALADRFGNLKVLLGGVVFYISGMLLIPYSDSPLLLNTTLGLMVGSGIGGTSFGIVLPALTRTVSPERRQWVLGVGTAAASMGQFLIVPIIGQLIQHYEWVTSIYLLAVLAGLMLLFSLPLAPFSGKHEAMQTGNQQKMKDALAQAFRYPSYIYLVLGFFVCGFQLGFITAHLPAFLTDQGQNRQIAAWSIALIGLGNIFGSYYSGVISGYRSKKILLSMIYFGRGVLIALFLILPLTPFTIVVFSLTMGLLWLATVPPTSGLVAVMFGTRYMATLYGIVFFNHQVGSFIGIWLGGVIFDATQSYVWIWGLSIFLSVVSALIHLPIVEKPSTVLSQEPLRS